MHLEELVSVSRRYGADPEYVVAGGGNTSYKDEETLYVKGSGTSLADIEAKSFVRMDRKKLAAIWEKDYPDDPDARESSVLADLMAARKNGEEQKRPSVETLLHDILPFAFVVHTHPALVNGLTCSVGGENAMRDVFGDEALWIPSTNPGYILSKTVKDAMEAYKALRGINPALIFLQNHGIFVGADTVAGIDELYKKVMHGLSSRVTRRPDFSGDVQNFGPSQPSADAIKELAGAKEAFVVFHSDNATKRLVANRDAFAPLASAYTPDHIVYAGSDPLFVDAGENPDEKAAIAAIRANWAAFVDEKKRTPKTVVLRGVGVFGVGASEKAASLAVALFKDAEKVAIYTEVFGGPKFMTKDQIDFINNWEVERYRSKISTTERSQS